MMELVREFGRLRGTEGYQLTIPRAGTELRVERLRRERGELVGELTVDCNLPGTLSTSGVLSVADLNLSSARARVERAKILADRSQADIGWSDIIEDLCQRVLAAERIGQPPVSLRDVPRADANEDVSVDGIRFLRRHPKILFGDGGDGKSYLAMYWATRLSAAGLRVGYFDWEFSGEDHRDRLERISGPDMPDITYVRCERPLTIEIDRLRRIVRENSLDYAFLDSVAFAADGPPEAAEVAARYFREVRRLGIGTCHLAHVTKAEGGDQKPFGSTFWANSARSTWYMKRGEGSADATSIHVALFNRKANTGPLAHAVGYAIEFAPDRTTFSTVDVADTTLADKLPVVQRIHALLGREGALTMAAIATELDIPVGTVVKTVKRHEAKRFIRMPGDDGVYRIGLVARGVA
jgi:hypothetical protein